MNHWALIRAYITGTAMVNSTITSTTKFIQFGKSQVGGKEPSNNQTGYYRSGHNDTRGK